MLLPWRRSLRFDGWLSTKFPSPSPMTPVTPVCTPALPGGPRGPEPACHRRASMARPQPSRWQPWGRRRRGSGSPRPGNGQCHWPLAYSNRHPVCPRGRNPRFKLPAARRTDSRARSPRWEPGMGMIPDPRQIGGGGGSGLPIPGKSGMGIGGSVHWPLSLVARPHRMPASLGSAAVAAGGGLAARSVFKLGLTSQVLLGKSWIPERLLSTVTGLS